MESQTSPFRLIPFVGLVVIVLISFAAVAYVRSFYASLLAADTRIIRQGAPSESGGKRPPGGAAAGASQSQSGDSGAQDSGGEDTTADTAAANAGEDPAADEPAPAAGDPASEAGNEASDAENDDSDASPDAGPGDEGAGDPEDQAGTAAEEPAGELVGVSPAEPAADNELAASAPSPEAVLRTFMFAMVDKDSETLQSVALPHDRLDVLVAGEQWSEGRIEAAKDRLNSLTFSRLAVGEAVELPNGESLEIDASMVAEDRLMLTFPGNSVPFALVRRDGAWKVDPEMIVAARLAARQAKAADETPR
jgi:hypothetical protein